MGNAAISNYPSYALTHERSLCQVGCHGTGNAKRFLGKFKNVTISYLGTRDGVKNACKVVKQSIDWRVLSGSPISPSTAAVHDIANTSKNVISAMEIPEKTIKLGQKSYTLMHEITSPNKIPKNTKEVIVAGSGLIGPIGDVIGLIVKKGIVKLSAERLRQVNIATFGSLAIGTGIGVCTEVRKIAVLNDEFKAAGGADATKNTAHKVAVALFSAWRFISYSALGTFGLMITFAVPIFPWLLPLCSTNALVATILGHYYAKMNDVPA